MPGSRRPPVIVFCCLFAGMLVTPAAFALTRSLFPLFEDGDADAGAGREGEPSLNLRLDRKFNRLGEPPKPSVPPLPGMPAAPAKPRDSYPLFISADEMQGKTDDSTQAAGNVELRKTGSQLFSDSLTYRPLEDEVEALGNVRLLQGDDLISGTHLRMKLGEQTGFFKETEYKLKREVVNRFYRPIPVVSTAVGTTGTTTGSAPLLLTVPAAYGLPTSVDPRRPSEAYGQAERIDFEGENQVRLNVATYSTCKPSEADWYVKAKEMQLDYDRESGKASDATVYFKDVPIFYTPTASFSLNRQRHSGFLPGSFGSTTKNGFEFTLPYYANIAPNYDATFYPRYMSKRGFQLGGEARYADHNFTGSTRFEYLPNDDIEKRSRHAYSLLHTHNLGRGLTASVNWQGVSDDFYWRDFSSRLMQTSQVQLPRQFVLGYNSGSWWNANVQTLTYQTLKLNSSIQRPYFIEPQINFSGIRRDFFNTDLSVLGQYTKFVNAGMPEGGRVVFYPQVSMPYLTPELMITPKLGLHATQYDLSVANPGNPTSISRVLPIFSLDATAFFERETRFLGGDYIQTLEPRLYYVNIPYKRQSQIPRFDTALSDFNFAQIFTENRYSGYDRINDANQLTAAVTSRFLNPQTGAERFKALIGQRYYFRKQRIPVEDGETVANANFSNLLAAFSGAVLPKTYVDAAMEYDYHQSQTERYSIGTRYQPELAKVLSASYRFTRNAISQGQVEQLDISGQWPLGKGWYGVGRYNYSVRDKQLLELIGGLEYNAGCWSTRFVVQRLEAIAGAANTTFFFQLELTDFASIGSSPLQLLRRTVPGYGKVNELPASGSLLTTP